VHYTPYYCEENAWWLAQDARLTGQQVDVVFISNATRSVAFFEQRAAQQPGDSVVWDYHVVVLARSEGQARIWDLDCLRGAPLPARAWLEASFDARVNPLYAPRFRLIAAHTFVTGFASDRRHMRAPDGRWQAPPPPWPILGGGAHNLEAFIDIADATWGETLSLDAFAKLLDASGG
jgi:hypothetical protein